MSDEWFQERIAPDGIAEDGCDPGEAHALQAYFAGRTTPAEAAFAITRPIATDPAHDTPGPWMLLGHAVETLPAKRPQTFALIHALDAFMPLRGFALDWEAGFRPIRHWRTPGRWPEKLGDAARRAAFRDEYRRLAAVEIEMLAAGVAPRAAHWGLICVGDALESSAALLDVELPAVREWVVAGGRFIRAAMREGEAVWSLEIAHDLYPGPDFQDTGPVDGARVAFWVERLRSIAVAEEDLCSEARECAIASAEILNSWIE